MTADPTDLSSKLMFDRYRDLTTKHNLDDPRALAYVNNRTQELRHRVVRKVLLDVGPYSVLDVGCGTGELLSYLDRRTMYYTGVDMMPEFIDKAKDRWKGRSVGAFNFKCTDFLTAPPGSIEPHEAVVSIGAMSFQPHHLAVEMLHKMWTLVDSDPPGRLVVTVKNDEPFGVTELLHYLNQWGVNNWEIHHTYLPDDFLLVARKDRLHYHVG